MTSGPWFIGSEIYRTSSYGSRHPLAIPRVSSVIDLCRALGWLPSERYLDSPRATPAELARFHDSDYLDALIEAERRQRASPDVRRRYNIGCNGNPVFAEMFRRPATACGGSLLAARRLSQRRGQRTVVYNPAGGTHHGRPSQASGFCYLNDPVLGILGLLDGGFERVFYLDVDAHHCDGVEAAFAEERRVFTLSIHEAGRWPMSRDGKGPGQAHDRAGGQARNLPVPVGFNDSELDYLLETVVLPRIAVFAPQAIVLQCGADALADDPLSKLALSNNALWRVVAAVKDLASGLLVLGGGGYNPWSVARCWTGVWATLNGIEIPQRLPEAPRAVLGALSWRRSQGRNPPDHWFDSLRDAPRPGPLRAEIRALAAQVMRD
ncbi:MAG: acetoin utilization protein AcuC [Pseudomonadota bacterium]